MVLEELASSLGRNDDEPNIELAQRLCESENQQEIEILVQSLQEKDKNRTGDCIKVIYEIGARKPELIAPYVEVLIKLLKSNNNRLVWGSMTALASITDLKSEEIFGDIEEILAAYKRGSVITIDQSITVFTKLCKQNEVYASKIFPMLLEHLKTCRAKEIPQHAERMSIAICEENKKSFIETLEKRKGELTLPQLKRLNRLISSL